MNQKQAIWQLRMVRAVIRRSRELGPLDLALRNRALQIVEQTAIEIEPEGDAEWGRLLEVTRADVLAE